METHGLHTGACRRCRAPPPQSPHQPIASTCRMQMLLHASGALQAAWGLRRQGGTPELPAERRQARWSTSPTSWSTALLLIKNWSGA